MAIIVFLSMSFPVPQNVGQSGTRLPAQLTAPEIDPTGRGAAVPRPAAPEGAGAASGSPLRFLLRFRS
jgi:hypothetical protein